MRMCDVGWVWEGQGLDPGVHPSIFGVGEGCTFFGLRKARFIFHDTTELALAKLSTLDEVVCDISKWRFRDCGERAGSECYPDPSLETILAEAELVSRLSLKYQNVVGGYFDDMQGLMKKRGHGIAEVESIYQHLKRHNPALYLEAVVYTKELGQEAFWREVAPYIDIVNLWVWGYKNLATLEHDLDHCREIFGDKPIRIGCYLRDYPSVAPMPMDAIRQQWRLVYDMLQEGRIEGYDILGTVLIEGQLEQAQWIRDFIRDHS